MESLILTMGLSIMLCLALIPLARALALRVGLVDRPDGHRKIHDRVVPVAGGLAVFASFWLVLAAAAYLPHPLQAAFVAEHQLVLGLFFASAIIVAVGVADDFGRLRGRHKLIGQIMAVLVLMRSGMFVQQISLCGWTIELGFFAGPFTCVLLLGAINSVNLIDGMDGLLGSLGWWLSMTLACLAGIAGHWWAVLIALALAGSLLGFLRYNLPPASIFMGDAGSMLVGLILGTLAIQCSLKAPATIAILLPIGLLTLPFFDTTAAIVRRKLTGRSIYTTDRGHLHHCLLKRGMSIRLVLVVVSVCCLVTCGGALASQAFDNELIGLFTIASVVFTLIWTRLFGHAELTLIRERVLNLMQPSSPARQMEVRLQGSNDWRPLWKLLTEAAEQLQLQEVRLDVNAPSLHEGYHARWDRGADADDVPTLWRVTIPLTVRGLAIGRLEIAGQPDGAPMWLKIATVTELIDGHAAPAASNEAPRHEAPRHEAPRHEAPALEISETGVYV
jgi:UDP-GlcNAc:undecaprenyl-phosphate/decaprenyl-phosphate GlcNAc-1-phosphate transferase